MSWFSRSDNPAPAKSAVEKNLSYSKREMDVLTACIKEVGLDYTELFKAAQTETGKMAILADANASCLGKIVQTKRTQDFVQRILKPSKSYVHTEHGTSQQELKDDCLTHQTVVEHTPRKIFEANKAKKGKDGEAKYHSANICALQLGVTSHLPAYTNQIAGVILMDGAREKTSQAVLGMGVIPLYKPTAHALFFPRICLSYNDDCFLDRLQLLTTFSEDVKGSGNVAMSYSTLSIVRHNQTNPAWLPEPLPWELIEKKYPAGVQSLSNFQVTSVSPLEPARLMRSASYVPINRKAPPSFLKFGEDGGATVVQDVPVMHRNSIDFTGVSYGNNSARKVISQASICGVHGKMNCPCACDQHCDNGVFEGSGPEPIAQSDQGPEGPTAIRALTSKEPNLAPDYNPLRTQLFTVPVSSSAGVVFRLPVGQSMLGNTTFGRQLVGLPWVNLNLKARLSGSASMQSKGLFWICYDPNDTLKRYPNRERALMLRGTWFMPGRYDSVDLDIEHLASPAGFVNLSWDANGSICVVLVDSLANMEVSDYAMELQVFARVNSTLPLGKSLHNSPLCENFLPLGQMIFTSAITTTIPKGTVFSVPLMPAYPAKTTQELYPSVSSSVLEAHSYWTGEIEIEIVFSMPALSGGSVIIGVHQDSHDMSFLDDYTRHGSTKVDLRAQRLVRLRANMQSWTSLNSAGRGSFFGSYNSATHTTSGGPHVHIIFPGPPIITDLTKNATMLVRYIGIHDPKLFTPVVAQNRFGSMSRVTPAGPSNPDDGITGTPRLVAAGDGLEGPKEWDWKDPYCVRIKDLFVKPRSFRIISFTTWVSNGWVHFPCTPCCYMPKFNDNFKGEVEPLNYLSHRAQENAMWRGTLRYYVKVNRAATKEPMNVIVLTAYPNEGLATTPSFTNTNKFVVSPVMSKEGTFLATGTQLVADITTPAEKWYWTRYGITDLYSRAFQPRWLSIQFPCDSALNLKVSSIDIFVEADLEFQFPIPPFPVKVSTETPPYYLEDTVRVD